NSKLLTVIALRPDNSSLTFASSLSLPLPLRNPPAICSRLESSVISTDSLALAARPSSPVIRSCAGNCATVQADIRPIKKILLISVLPPEHFFPRHIQFFRRDP